MPRAATDVMQSILFSAVLDAIAGLKAGSGGLPNNLLRDIQSIHPNTTFADLPKTVQDAIVASTRSAFTAFLKEGYAVGPKATMTPQRPIDRVPERERRGSADRRFVRSGPGRRGQGHGPVKPRPRPGGGKDGGGNGGNGGGGGGKRGS